VPAVIFTMVACLAVSPTQERGRPAQGGANKALPTVETIAVTLEDPTAYRVVGVLEPGRSVTLRATSDGIVREVAADVGKAVKQGDLVARLDPSEAKARFQLAEAQLKEHQIALETDKPLGQKPTAMGVNQTRVQAAEAQLELARLALAATNLSAP